MNSRFIRFLNIILVIALTLPVTVVQITAAPSAQGIGVTPGEIRIDLVPGDGLRTQFTITTAEIPIAKADVFLLFDVTGSMSGVIEQAKENASVIVDAIRASVPDTDFGVGSFSDYPGFYDHAGYAAQYGDTDDYPWMLNLDITGDVRAVQTTLKSLTLGNGEDPPEDYARALFETAWIGWRSGAKHIVVLFGDAPAHDPTFYMPEFGLNFGIDPGHDAEAGTDDDLSFTEAVDLLVQREIEVIPINSDLSGTDYVQAGFEYIAAQTGGQVYPISDATEVADVIVQGVSQATTIIGEMKVVADDEYSDWATITPSVISDVGGGETHTFDVSLLVPTDADPGMHTFNLTVVGDGAILGQVPVILDIAPPALDVDKLLAEKDELIDFLCAPEAPIKVLGFNVALFSPSGDEDTYCVQEAAVDVWIQDLKTEHASDDLQPASALALEGLWLQEQAFRDLWLHQVEASNIIGEHVGHVIGVAWSMVSIVRFLDHVDSKHVVGLLVTKIKNIVAAKILGAINSFLQWTLDSLPPSAERDNLKAGLDVLKRFTDKAFEDALKKKADFGEVLIELVVEGGLSFVTTDFSNTSYVGATQGEISRGLKEAQMTAAQSMEPSVAYRQARQRANDVNATLGRVQGEANSLASYSTDVQEMQDAAKAIAEVADALSLIAALPGPGQIIGAFARGVAIAERLFDIALSGTVVGSAVDTRNVILQASKDATNQAFGLPVSSAAVGPEPSRPGSVHLASMAPPPSLAGELAPPAARAMFERVQQASTDYQTLLDQLTAAIQAGEANQAKTLTESLIAADESLNAELLSTRAPIFAGASTLLERGDSTFGERYERFGQSAVDFDLQGALLYVYLLGHLAQPEDPVLRDAALDQIETIGTALDDYVISIEQTLPLVQKFIAIPVVIVTAYTAPAVAIGEPFDLLLELRNPGSLDARNATVSAVVGDSVELLSPSPIQLDSVPADGSAEASFRLRLTQPQAVIRVDTNTENGKESMRYIVLNASVIPTPPPVSGGTVWTPVRPSGLSPAILLLTLLAGVGAALVIVAVSRRSAAPMPPSPPSPQLFGTLQVTVPGQPSRTVFLSRLPFTIGRQLGCDLVLSDPQASRPHAHISVQGGTLILEDLGSINGTFVNGRRIQRHVLRSGDEIQIGQTRLRFSPRH